ncbi:MAG: hypothetical protein OEY74_01725 [Gammaproteobacteria bacterium]|nr:hypothetical protein [Gammaproteobacteria bacterium]
MQNENSQFEDQDDREIAALLKDYPMPQASADFFDRALVRATHEGSRRQRNRWLMTGFGSAVAAGLVLWMVGGFLLSSQDLPGVDPAVDSTIPGVTIALEEPHTVKLVFASVEALDTATLTVLLPEGIEISGFPGQREVTWETSLRAGKNLLPLKLIATSPYGGEVLATLRHDDRGRTFRLRVDVG